MEVLSNLLTNINEQLALHHKIANDSTMELHIRESHKKLHEKFFEINNSVICLQAELNVLETENSRLKEKIKEFEDRAASNDNFMGLLMLRKEEMEGLPEEQLKELKEFSKEKSDSDILDIINENKGYATLDQLIVRLFKKTGKMTTRNSLTARLYKLSRSGLIFSVQGQKGVYSTFAQDLKKEAPVAPVEASAQAAIEADKTQELF